MDQEFVFFDFFGKFHIIEHETHIIVLYVHMWTTQET